MAAGVRNNRRERIWRLAVELIERLSLYQRAAMLLFYLDGCSLGEIAAILHCTPRRAGALLRSGKVKLEYFLRQEYPDQGELTPECLLLAMEDECRERGLPGPAIHKALAPMASWPDQEG